MERIVHLTHFGPDKTKRPKTLDILLYPASVNDSGWAEEGNLLLSIDDLNMKANFQLSPAEAALLRQRLGHSLNTLADSFRLADQKAGEKRKAKPQ